MKLPDDDLERSKHVGVVSCVLKCFTWKLYRCIRWLIVEVNLGNARSNDEIHCIELPDDGSLVIPNILEQF